MSGQICIMLTIDGEQRFPEITGMKAMEATTLRFVNWLDERCTPYALDAKQLRQYVIEFVAEGFGTIEWGRKYVKEYGG